MQIEFDYLTGFGNYFQSEAESGALNKNQNSPQSHHLGLYAEQLSGSAFTANRSENAFSWLYRINPSVKHSEFKPYKHDTLIKPDANFPTPPTQMRWDPLPHQDKELDFIDGLVAFANNGSELSKQGSAIHLYSINKSMGNKFFYNSDGEMLIVPFEGTLVFHTEFGSLALESSEIIVIPRGVKFTVDINSENARGYICENFGVPFKLPELGIIGANGLANPRHFEIPTANYIDKNGNFKLINKFQGNLWQADMGHCPLDVVAWHGNYTPFKYDLKKFNTINTVSFDHPDPSIFTVLTSPSDIDGTANLDFVIFPSRWMVATNTFRPPYYHRNTMNEYMGLIYGKYDAKESGFVPGGATLHNCMTAHGPDAESFDSAKNKNLQPEYYENTLAFMFESKLSWQLTKFALQTKIRQHDYLECWQELGNNFQSKIVCKS